MPAKKRRSAIGEDPLDLVVPGKPKKAPEKGKAAPKEENEEGKAQKVRATFHLPEDLVEEARDAVVHLSGPPVRLTLAALAEDALRRELARLRRKHNDGEPWPKRDGNLKGGRPIGS